MCLYYVVIIVTEQINGGLAAWLNKSQICETGAHAKGKGFYSGATRLGRMADSHPKDQSLFLLKPGVLVGIGRGWLFFLLSNYLGSFWCVWGPCIHFLACVVLGFYPFIFLAFGAWDPLHYYF